MRIAHIFRNCDLRCQHAGLEAIAKSAKVDLEMLAPGSICIFLNRKLDKVKTYVLGGIVSYYRAPSGRLNLMMIEQIPNSMGNKGRINWERAEMLALDKQLKEKK